MPAIHKSALLPYSVRDMYVLVEDIAAYPSFLPWCKQAQILQRDGEQVQASITLSRSGIEKTFTTTNTLRENEFIEMRLLHGPFSHLHGRWQFTPLGEQGCKVALDMEFDFSSKLLKMTLGPVFSQIMNALVDAFARRANELYGQRRPPA
jgi:ribosome-associated toxin RatA of RatAB toxin-antitoxin module